MATGKLTIKQEAFALAYIETGNASEAYRRAYDATRMKPETVNRVAFEALGNPKIAARIEGLLEQLRVRHEVTVDSICAELETARLQALAAGHHNAAVQASMGKAKLHGLLTEKREITGKDQGPVAFVAKRAEQLTDEELMEIILAGSEPPERTESPQE